MLLFLERPTSDLTGLMCQLKDPREETRMNICFFCLLFAFATEPTENSLYTELCFLYLAADVGDRITRCLRRRAAIWLRSNKMRHAADCIESRTVQLSQKSVLELEERYYCSCIIPPLSVLFVLMEISWCTPVHLPRKCKRENVEQK